MSDLTEATAACEQSRADLRAAVEPAAAEYAEQLRATVEAELRWAQDPDRDDLAQAARAARDSLADAREAFDKKVAAEKGQHTRRVNDAIAELL
jgi:hypothetical protein